MSPWPAAATLLLQALAPGAPWYLRWALRHAHWPPVGGLLARLLATRTAESRAMVQTTAIATLIHAGGWVGAPARLRACAPLASQPPTAGPPDRWPPAMAASVWVASSWSRRRSFATANSGKQEWA
jgi:hypothetical protein